MDPASLSKLVRDLSSLDHAILLSLIACEHCIIETEGSSVNDVAQEIQLVSSHLFGLSNAVVDCQPDTTLEEFNSGILIAAEDEEASSKAQENEQSTSFRRMSTYSITKPRSSTDYTIANVVIAKNLNLASRQIQVQALELIRTKRIFTHTSLHSIPKPFLLVAVTSTGTPKLNLHLNDMIFLSHYHDPIDDSLPRLDTAHHDSSGNSSGTSTRSSDQSIVRSSQPTPKIKSSPAISPSNLQHLTSLLPTLDLIADVRSYLMTLAISIRTHRALFPGSATPTATRHLELLSRSLGLIHGLEYVSPALVAIAAHKVYRHRLRIMRPKDASWDRSLMYGSRVSDVREMLEEMWTADVDGDGDDNTGNSSGNNERFELDESDLAQCIIEEVIDGVEVPV